MPGLITLKTDLKSLKYGADRPGGGSSGQPYIKTDINTVDNDFNKIRLTKFDDGFIRGGVVGSLNASTVDTLRISKFLIDLPKGPLFIAKQVGLQLSNPRLEVKKNTKLGGWLGNTITDITNFAKDIVPGPTRIYNLGINTLAQIPVNAFGGHITRHGLTPFSEYNYEAVVKNNNENGNNRLLNLTNKLINTEDNTISNYLGGPGSVYGIGNTLIKRYIKTRTKQQGEEDKIQIQAGYTRDKQGNPIVISYENALGKGMFSISRYGNLPTGSNEIKKGISNNTIKYSLPVKMYDELRKQIENSNSFKVNTPNQIHIINTGSYSTTPTKISYSNTYGDIYSVKGFNNWNDISREQRVGSGRKDQINLTPIFREGAHWSQDTITINKGDKHNIRDLIKFRIQAVNGDNPNIGDWMIFRAYLTQFNDNVDASWNEIKYAGRGDKFYIYDGFTRKISIGFKVAALSAAEMKPMYQKLNFLMSNLMPDYKNNLMRGPLMRMTVGNYIDCQLGVLNSLSYNITNDTPWEIALDEPEGGTKQLILPHIIEVSLGFTPIGSESKGFNELTQKTQSTSNIAQNNTGDTKFQYVK